MNFVIGLIGFLMIVGSIVLLSLENARKNSRRYSEPEPAVLAKNKRTRVILALVGVLILLFSMSFTIIPTGYSGVRTTFGQISPNTATNGWNWKLPMVQSVEKVNIKQQDVTFKDRVWSETSARTAIYYEGVTVTYQVEATKAAWIFANVTDYRSSLVSSDIVASAIKMSSKGLTDVDATNRGMIEPLVQENLQKSLDNKYGGRVVYINKVTISNVDFDDTYNAAISQKQVAALQAEAQAIENQKAIDKAKADAEVSRTIAQGKADAEIIQAEGTAKANAIIEESLTEGVEIWEIIQKWSGNPSYVVGSPDTMLDVSRWIPAPNANNE